MIACDILSHIAQYVEYQILESMCATDTSYVHYRYNDVSAYGIYAACASLGQSHHVHSTMCRCSLLYRHGFGFVIVLVQPFIGITVLCENVSVSYEYSPRQLVYRNHGVQNMAFA